ncbi:MAG TPA: DUF58 domain-containing protein [Kiloniellaceae bacterium]|nr:DUF58 domain-containing protein [Kiloniellaceae bacterium]
MPARHRDLQLKAKALAGGLPALLVAAERVAATVSQGVHGRRRSGQGETFWQFRPYYAGDAPNAIDWRQTAKSDRVFVREMEWEAAQSVWLWHDTSPSMDWRSSGELPSKAWRSKLLLLALSVLLLRAGERVGLVGIDRRPLNGQSALHRLAASIGADQQSGRDLPPRVPLPRHARAVFVGDFLSPLDDIERQMSNFAEAGVRGHILQVLDPAEETLPYSGRIHFEGLKGEEPWLLSRAERVRQDYIGRLERQRDGLRALARAFNWTFDHHRCDKPAESALLSLYMALADPEGV